MKKFIVFLLCFISIFPLVSCSNSLKKLKDGQTLNIGTNIGNFEFKNSYNKQTEDYYLYYYTRLDLQFNISITKPNAEIYDYYNNRYYYFESTYSTTQKTYIGKKTTIIEINYSYLANNKSNFITVQKSKTVTTNYGYPDEFLFYPCVFNIDMGNISFSSFENLPNLSRFFDETIVPGVIKYHIVAEDNTETQIDKMTYEGNYYIEK